MNRTWVYLIYNLLLPVVLVLGLPRFLIKGIQRGGLARNFRQRFGRYRPEIREKLSREGNLWIHAVSVGEVLVAVKLIRALREQAPGRPIVLSTTTTTGFAVAERESGENVTVIHNPVDLPWVVNRTLNLIRPERLILVEAEVWPNLVRKARSRGVPVVLVNARLSERSEKRFHQFSALTIPVLAQLDRVCVPFDTDVERWEGLGVSRDRIEVTGSVKFDEAVDAIPGEKIAELRDWLEGQGVEVDSARILLAGSTHSGEEALIGQAWREVRKRFPDLVYVSVPRHAERARSARAQLREAGLAPVFRVALNGERGEPEASKERCFVANTTGELRAWFHLAEVVVIGKSFIGRGGQNPVEPIVAGKPVVVGPRMGNFSAIVADLELHEGIVRLEGVEVPELADALERLFADSDAAVGMAKNGMAAVNRHRGAANRTAEKVLDAKAPDFDLKLSQNP